MKDFAVKREVNYVIFAEDSIQSVMFVKCMKLNYAKSMAKFPYLEKVVFCR